jgi:hypothetical protein
VLQATERHWRYQRQVTSAVVRAAETAWGRVTLADLDASWAAVAGGVAAVVGAGQQAAARDADPYLAAVLAEQGQPDAPVGQVQPAAFVGVAADGRDLAGLLAEPLIGVKTAIKAGDAPAQALTSGGSRLAMLAMTTVQDAGRLAVTAGMIAGLTSQGMCAHLRHRRAHVVRSWLDAHTAGQRGFRGTRAVSLRGLSCQAPRMRRPRGGGTRGNSSSSALPAARSSPLPVITRY